MNITQILDACTGCGVCAAVCPSAAVKMQPDAHGFLRPIVDDAACTDCGLCTEKCPVSVLPQVSVHTDIMTGYAKDGALLPRSSSGAIFPVLAAEIIRRGGLVFGAAFDESFDVVHTVAESMVEISALCSSKYVQGRVPSDCYAQVKAALAVGRWVYFSGLPCQVAALKSYLGRDYETLITQDTACHSVPSPLVWDEYKSGLEKQYGGKLTAFSFRKKANGWEAYHIRAAFDNGREFAQPAAESPYQRGYIKGLYSRSSCFVCKFKGIERCSDITLADYWGVKDIQPEAYNLQGTPSFCCTAKRDEAFWKAARLSCNSSPQSKTRLPLTRRCLHPFKSPSAMMNSGRATVKRPLPIWFPPAASRPKKNWRRNAEARAFWPTSCAA